MQNYFLFALWNSEYIFMKNLRRILSLCCHTKIYIFVKSLKSFLIGKYVFKWNNDIDLWSFLIYNKTQYFYKKFKSSKTRQVNVQLKKRR